MQGRVIVARIAETASVILSAELEWIIESSYPCKVSQQIRSLTRRSRHSRQRRRNGACPKDACSNRLTSALTTNQVALRQFVGSRKLGLATIHVHPYTGFDPRSTPREQCENTSGIAPGNCSLAVNPSHCEKRQKTRKRQSTTIESAIPRIQLQR